MPKAKKSTSTKKSTKKKTTSKKKAAGSGKKGGGRKKYNDLSPNEIKVLQCLEDNGEMSRAELTDATGIQKGWAKLLGSPTKEIKEDSLEGRKLVKHSKYEPQEGDEKHGKRAGFVYDITATGKKALAKALDEQAADAEEKKAAAKKKDKESKDE